MKKYLFIFALVFAQLSYANDERGSGAGAVGRVRSSAPIPMDASGSAETGAKPFPLSFDISFSLPTSVRLEVGYYRPLSSTPSVK